MDKIIIVTDGSREIGQGIYIELATRRYSVAINYAGNRKLLNRPRVLQKNRGKLL